MTDNESPPPRSATYAPEVFDVVSADDARRIILTPEAGTTTDTRWETETPWLADRILDHFPLTERHVVVDFGCGLGRMAKVLIERTQCWVIGVDLSARMRQLAPGYVQSPKFAAMAPAMLDLLIARGLRAELALSIWVLQHAVRPDIDVGRLQRVVTPGGGLFIANNLRRAVPTDQGWADDGVDVEALVNGAFRPIWRGTLPQAIGGDVLPQASFVAASIRT
jgi:SAM-dependent methyltransferase